MDHILSGDFQSEPNIQISGILLHACANGKGNTAFSYIPLSPARVVHFGQVVRDTTGTVVVHRQYFQEM